MGGPTRRPWLRSNNRGNKKEVERQEKPTKKAGITHWLSVSCRHHLSKNVPWKYVEVLRGLSWEGGHGDICRCNAQSGTQIHKLVRSALRPSNSRGGVTIAGHVGNVCAALAATQTSTQYAVMLRLSVCASIVHLRLYNSLERQLVLFRSRKNRKDESCDPNVSYTWLSERPKCRVHSNSPNSVCPFRSGGS